ncbi:telomere repeat binding factor-domain-containing protein [Sordaria brevicollis]|uniref:Telomere repeat binding factor-domain-containing protein n=1 Tax=Sordaria brevicollis TaxID=83679 RepID=A0AAE0P2U0_SORBR|nr:telomere repeat binding factor-domain-containing protein [Sordaria brevicollis]
MADPILSATFEANLLAALSTHSEESKSPAPATATPPAPAPAPAPATSPATGPAPASNFAPTTAPASAPATASAPAASPAPAPTSTPASIPNQNVAPPPPPLPAPQPAQQHSRPQQPPLNHAVQSSQAAPIQTNHQHQQQMSQTSALSQALQQALQSSNTPSYQAPPIHHPQPLSTTTAAPVSQPLVQAPPSHPSPQVVPNMPPQPSSAPVEPPKRARSPHPADDSNQKRLKLEQGDEMDLDTPFDIKAALASALGDFEKQHGQAGNDSSLDNSSGPTSAPQPPAVSLSATATPMPEKGGDKLMKASSNSAYMIRSMSLPVLGNLAVQILLRLSQQPRSETRSLLAETDGEFRKHYDLLTESFKLARRAFSDSPVLLPDELEINDSEDRETIRVANLATTAISVFGANDVSCKDLDDSFFSIFVPEDGEFKDTLTDLLLSLKTQALLDSLNEQTTLQQLTGQLDKLFPDNFEEWLKQRNLDVVTETDADQLAVKIKERKELLSTVAKTENFKASLESKYSSDIFPEALCAFLQSHIGVIVEYAEEYGVKIPISEEPIVTAPGQNGNNVQDEHADLAALLQSKIVENGELKDFHTGSANNEASVLAEENFDLSKLIEQSLPDHINEVKDGLMEQNGQGESSGLFDTKDLADFIAAKLNDNLETPSHGLQNVQQNPYEDTMREHHGQVHPQYHNLNQLQNATYHQYPQASPSNTVMGTAGNETLPPNQSCPTSVLYEKARQAAVAKSSSTTRREGLHSTRRPWTPDEEKALMLGLDLVKGPHWSQILSLFGQHGTISDILKDRTQVQLKDKARNLKLFFLKTNSEMPYYLQSVTGELKTRAPGQAARKEAEEKARLNAEDEQARLAGIMTLGGLHNSHHQGANGTIAPSPARAHTTTPGPGNGHMNGTPTPTPTQAPTNQQAALAPVPISPMVKTEPVDHPTHQVSNLPQIQPAPAPQSLQPALKPQPQPQSLHQQQSQQHLQHPQPNGQHLQQQTQQHPQPLQPLRPQQQPQQLPQSQIRSQTPQTAQSLAPAPPQQYHQQHHHHHQQQQGQQLHQQPLQQPQQPHQQHQQHQPQQQLQQSQQPQPQLQQQHQQPQAQPQPQIQAQPQAQPQQQQQQHQAGTAPVSTPMTTPITSTTAAAQPVVSVATAEPTPASSAVNNHTAPSFGLPPIPPNHHSTPDQAQDVKLFETLQAAIGATSPAHESHPAATVPETSSG